MTARRFRLGGPPRPKPRASFLVHQEILLIDGLSVADNLFLGREITRRGIIDKKAMQSHRAPKN